MDTIYSSRVHGLNPNMSQDKAEFTEDAVMSLVIVLGSSLSLVGLVFAFITYSLFSDIRSLGGTTLMNLLAAMFMSQLLHVIGVGTVMDKDLCLALAIAIDYSRLSILCWILAFADNLNRTFKSNVHLLPEVTPKIGTAFIRYSLIGWFTPIALLSLAFGIQIIGNGTDHIIDYHNRSFTYHAHSGHHNRSVVELHGVPFRLPSCWFLSRDAIPHFYVIPSCFILLLTCYFLLRSSQSSRLASAAQMSEKVREKMSKRRGLQIRLGISLTIMNAIVFLLCTLAGMTKISGVWVAFAVTSSFQGIIVTLCVTCNCKLLKTYSRSWKRIRRGMTAPINVYGAVASEVSKSSNFNLLEWKPDPDII